MEQLDIDMKQGFVRVEVNRQVMRIEDYLIQLQAEGESKKANVYLLIDRMSADNDQASISRLTDSAETAMYEGGEGSSHRVAKDIVKSLK